MIRQEDADAQYVTWRLQGIFNNETEPDGTSLLQQTINSSSVDLIDEEGIFDEDVRDIEIEQLDNDSDFKRKTTTEEGGGKDSILR